MASSSKLGNKKNSLKQSSLRGLSFVQINQILIELSFCLNLAGIFEILNYEPSDTSVQVTEPWVLPVQIGCSGYHYTSMSDASRPCCSALLLSLQPSYLIDRAKKLRGLLLSSMKKGDFMQCLNFLRCHMILHLWLVYIHYFGLGIQYFRNKAVSLLESIS